jgi:hypothetical protein
LLSIITLKTVNTKFFVKMYAIDTDNGKSMVKILWLYFVMFATEVFFAVFVKTKIFLGNPDTPIERSHKKKIFKKK